MWFELTLRIAVISAVFLMAALFRRIPLFQPKPATLTKNDLPELRKQYSKWESFAILPMFFCLAVFSWGSYHVLALFAKFIRSLGEQPLFFVTLPNIAWMLPAMGIAFLLTIPVLDRLYRYLLGDRYGEYKDYCDLAHGVHGWRMLLFLCWGLLLAGALFIPQMMRTHISFFHDEIRLRPLLSFVERPFDYTEIVQLAHVQHFQALNGKWIDRPHHLLEFSDGTVWTTRSFSNPDPPNDATLFKFLSGKTKLPINKLKQIE